MSRVPLFVELCCGSAAVTLRLLSAHARPPISYMGAKTGYAQAILHVLGLRSGQGAGAVVLVEAGPWARAWRLLTTPEGCRAVAAVIRSWIGEDARALWERLRAEPVPAGEAEAVGAWCYLASVAYCAGDAGGPGFVHPEDGGRYGAARADVVGRCTSLSSLRWPPVQVVEGDACGVSPEAVARWLWVQARTMGENGGMIGGGNTHPAISSEGMVRVIGDSPCWPPTVIAQADVATVDPGALPPGTVVYLDPPYSGTTGYQHKLDREQVLTIARRWSDAGAVVCVSEAVPLDLPGWHHVEITGCRVGQKRTFSKQQREWLTLNREPAWLPDRQTALDLGQSLDAPHGAGRRG